MVFKFKDWDTLKKVYDTRPWSVDGNLIILHDYNHLALYQELDWVNQCFWIQLQHILPEHMNVKAVEAMGKLMGDVIAIDPPNAIPTADEPVMQININSPPRRGVMAITASGG